MNPTDYQKLKEVIQAANPEIIELYEACGWHTDMMNWRDCKQCMETAKPRTIRLADVLLAIDKQKSPLFGTVATNGWVHFNTARTFWNLKNDSLDHQSDDTKQFLFDLLCS